MFQFNTKNKVYLYRFDNLKKILLNIFLVHTYSAHLSQAKFESHVEFLEQ